MVGGMLGVMRTGASILLQLLRIDRVYGILFEIVDGNRSIALFVLRKLN